MQTELADFIRGTPEGREAEEILRKCVHCGFCTATCPTYQVLGDDLDSPRGRIYLMKRALEGGAVSDKTRLHLDRCLTCRACEASCCGALRFHLNYQERGRDDMRALIDAWWPLVESGEVEAIVMTASGCGVTVREYGHYLAEDPAYRDKAARIAALTKDLSEVIAPEALSRKKALFRVAFQSPCTLQHGQQIRGRVERLLEAVGYEVTPVDDAHLCCGSAGAYSLLQAPLARAPRARQPPGPQFRGPTPVAPPNIGCLSHLQAGTATPVRHWIELVDAAA